MEETQPWILPLDTNEKRPLYMKRWNKMKMYKGNLLDWKERKKEKKINQSIDHQLN